MRALFVCWAWPSHLHPMVPLAGAVRAAGHEVLVGCPPSLVATALRTGLPCVAVDGDADLTGTVRKMLDRARPGGPDRRRPRVTGAPRRTPLDMFARMGEDMADSLLSLARRWRPDLIVHDATTYVATAVGRVLGVPTVRHLWGVDFPYLLREFEPAAFGPLWERLGAGEVTVSGGTPTLDPCPPGLQIPVGYTPYRLRHLPYNGVGRHRPPRLPPARRPRVCVTWGTTSSVAGGEDPVLTEVLEGVAASGVDVVFATTGRDGLPAAVGPHWHTVVMEPLHTLVPQCDAVISPGGSGTVMTTLAAGLPQVVVPLLPDQEATAERLVATGCGLRVPSREVTREAVRDALDAILHDPGHRVAAHRLRDEMTAERTPVAAVGLVEELAANPRELRQCASC